MTAHPGTLHPVSGHPGNAFPVIGHPGTAHPRSAGGLSFPPPLGLYLHLPWCLSKCPYCDFNSHAVQNASGGQERFDRYIDALIADLEGSLPAIWGRTVQTVFLGGGTPSLFPPEAVGRLLAALRSLVRLQGAAEVTMEVNPGTFEVERFEAFRDAGINRLSLGVQSFSDACLARIGRVHDAAQAIKAAETAIALFDRVNIDLMYGQPGQRLEDLRRDLDLLATIGAGHASLYQFTLEPHTWFANRPPREMPSESLLDDMQRMIEDTLPALGLMHYEVSAWARPSEQCRHNLSVWQFGDYLGLGAGAHSKISNHEGIWRQVRTHHPERYMQGMLHACASAPGEDTRGQAVAWPRKVAERELPFEFMLNVLRLRDGVPSAFLPERTGIPVTRINRVVTRAVERGLLEADPRIWRATPLGWRFLNDLQTMFLDDGQKVPDRCDMTH